MSTAIQHNSSGLYLPPCTTLKFLCLVIRYYVCKGITSVYNHTTQLIRSFLMTLESTQGTCCKTKNKTIVQVFSNKKDSFIFCLGIVITIAFRLQFHHIRLFPSYLCWYAIVLGEDNLVLRSQFQTISGFFFFVLHLTIT